MVQILFSSFVTLFADLLEYAIDLLVDTLRKYQLYNSLKSDGKILPVRRLQLEKNAADNGFGPFEGHFDMSLRPQMAPRT